LVRLHDLLECAGGTGQSQIVVGMPDGFERKGMDQQMIHQNSGIGPVDLLQLAE